MFLIKLTKESGDKLWRVQSSDLTREIGTVTKVAAGSKKEDLDTVMSSFFVIIVLYTFEVMIESF